LCWIIGKIKQKKLFTTQSQVILSFPNITLDLPLVLSHEQTSALESTHLVLVLIRCK
jgi:hypothetical protein